MQADCIHDFALESLGKSFSTDALEILIRNYKERDKDFIFCQFEKIKIDQDNTSGWHNVILQILHTADEIYLPDEFFIFIYERSRCSFCRENAVEELKKRNLLTPKIISECLWDCNKEIRSMVENAISMNE